MAECTLHNLLTSCQYPQVFWIYQMNDYDENILLTKGTKQEMLEGNDSFDLIDHINDVVEYWTIREDGAMFVRIRMNDRAKELYSDNYVEKWDRYNPLKRPYLYSAEMDDFTNCIYGSSEYMHPYGDPLDCHHWADRKTENSSEIPNNCEHITEDGVTCAKYPACDDCLDNLLNKVKGSERLVKGKDEPQTCSVNGRPYTDCCNCEYFKCTADEPQMERKCVNCKFLTYMFGKTWCNIKCDNPHDKVCDRWQANEPQTNADQHVQRVEYVENDEKSRCWECKYFERMHETPIASDGRYYTYVVCTAKECHYEPKDEPTISKMEQVDKDINVRSKDEPQRERSE